ncbi:4-hydroxyproline epimerase [Zooshikella marina]|uniref:4-hydroxyproline epimerase n=1 Tax=Zooshikella ganghwensis TaxID=202772 RepID=A0A4P9VNG0_9GAMM|nr:4-hydroxyproline epimerase [Zooshikella ganghwensis]MBU2705291.1 4-hydroxyproline epimerase [Zooshikella ganghwensis]RDH44436.1 4-hydroxyproline epimerase [Zooshikella ganghwensis]
MRKGTFFCIDAHTCGNPARLVTNGHPHLIGESMSEKRQYFLEHYDWIRQALMFEPRGHAMMSGAFLYPPCTKMADASILFIETSGCLPMCGHGTIGTVTAALESGLLHPKKAGELILDAPAGTIHLTYKTHGNYVSEVTIFNVPAFLAHQDIKVNCPELGELSIDIAYGGNFYAIIDPQPNYQGLESISAQQILHYSPRIREQINQTVTCQHPFDETISGLNHILWTGAPTQPEAISRNAVFFGKNAIDRSPCGTGTSARMAQWAAKGRLNEGDHFVHESIIGSLFTGRIEAMTEVGHYPAILPSITGWAKVIGHNTIWVDTDDPYWQGFEVK